MSRENELADFERESEQLRARVVRAMWDGDVADVLACRELLVEHLDRCVAALRASVARRRAADRGTTGEP